MATFLRMMIPMVALISATCYASMGPGLKTSADRMMRNIDNHTVTLLGDAVVEQSEHRLKADRIQVDTKNGVVCDPLDFDER